MFEQVFKNIDDILFKDSGANSELDYVEQTSWVLFLRYLDEIEKENAEEAILSGDNYEFLIKDEFQWSSWAMPKGQDGKVDHHVALTGPDLVEFVNQKLFPYLSNFKHLADNPQTLEYKVGEIFSELKNNIQSGYNLRDVIELADGLPFGTEEERFELSHLYETKIKNMGNAGRNGGQYYTPRPLIRTMIKVIDPKIGETIYDPALGSAGFLCEAFGYIRGRMEKTTDNLTKLQENTLYGKEKKSLAYVIGVMNMILHGIEAPNVIRTNTLGENIREIQEKDRHDIILANPPFGGKERAEVQQNFDIKTGETASLFLQHMIKTLKAGGRAAVVIKNTFLTNASGTADINMRKLLLETCRLDAVLDLPRKVFGTTGTKTIVLFFKKGEPTKKIWYYQLKPGRSLGKTNPLIDEDLAEFIELQKTKPETERSWMLKIGDVDEKTYDLSVKNPNLPEEAPLRDPKEILKEMEVLDSQTNVILKSIKDFL